MLKTQVWWPDTHPEYEIHTQWDTDEPQAAHVCIAAFHNGEPMQDPEAVYGFILTENRLKNDALAAILDAIPQGMKKAVLDSDGDPTGQFVVKDKHTPEWSFGVADGKLSFTVPGADTETLQALALALASFGEDVTVG